MGIHIKSMHYPCRPNREGSAIILASLSFSFSLPFWLNGVNTDLLREMKLVILTRCITRQKLTREAQEIEAEYNGQFPWEFSFGEMVLCLQWLAVKKKEV